MYRHSFGNLLLRPSFLSSIVCGLFVFITLVSANWTFILNNLSLYDYFFGPEGLVTVLRYNFVDGSTASQTANGSPDHSSLSVILGTIAAAIGLAIAGWIIIKVISSISMTIREVRAADTPARHAVENDLLKRAAVRLLVLVIWAAYVFIFIKVALPFCILASQVGMGAKSDIGLGVGYILFAIGLLFAGAHLHVVLARLLLLRPRVFGSQDVVITR